MLISHENAHQKVTSTEEEFNNQVGWMAHAVEISLFPKSFLPLLKEPMNNVTIITETDITHRFTSMD